MTKQAFINEIDCYLSKLNYLKNFSGHVALSTDDSVGGYMLAIPGAICALEQWAVSQPEPDEE